jgi:hypothetical protein
MAVRGGLGETRSSITAAGRIRLAMVRQSLWRASENRNSDQISPERRQRNKASRSPPFGGLSHSTTPGFVRATLSGYV